MHLLAYTKSGDNDMPIMGLAENWDFVQGLTHYADSEISMVNGPVLMDINHSRGHHP